MNNNFFFFFQLQHLKYLLKNPCLIFRVLENYCSSGFWKCIQIGLCKCQKCETHNWRQHRRGRGGMGSDEGTQVGCWWRYTEQKRGSEGRLKRWGVSKGKHNGSCDLWRWTSDPQKRTGGCEIRLLPNARLQQHTLQRTVGTQVRTEICHPTSEPNTNR